MQNIEEIYEEYFEAIYRYLYCITRNSDLSEELAQETFYKAILKTNSIKENYDISAWLCGIAKNLLYDRFRKEKRIINYGEDELFNMQDVDLIENTIIDKEEKNELYKRIDKLEKIQREVVYLRVSGNLSFREIALILGKTENWARIVFYRAKNKLKEEYENER